MRIRRCVWRVSDIGFVAFLFSLMLATTGLAQVDSEEEDVCLPSLEQLSACDESSASELAAAFVSAALLCNAETDQSEAMTMYRQRLAACDLDTRLGGREGRLVSVLTLAGGDLCAIPETVFDLFDDFMQHLELFAVHADASNLDDQDYYRLALASVLRVAEASGTCELDPNGRLGTQLHRVRDSWAVLDALFMGLVPQDLLENVQLVRQAMEQSRSEGSELVAMSVALETSNWQEAVEQLRYRVAVPSRQNEADPDVPTGKSVAHFESLGAPEQEWLAVQAWNAVVNRVSEATANGSAPYAVYLDSAEVLGYLISLSRGQVQPWLSTLYTELVALSLRTVSESAGIDGNSCARLERGWSMTADHSRVENLLDRWQKHLMSGSPQLSSYPENQQLTPRRGTPLGAAAVMGMANQYLRCVAPTEHRSRTLMRYVLHAQRFISGHNSLPGSQILDEVVSQMTVLGVQNGAPTEVGWARMSLEAAQQLRATAANALISALISDGPRESSTNNDLRIAYEQFVIRHGVEAAVQVCVSYLNLPEDPGSHVIRPATEAVLEFRDKLQLPDETLARLVEVAAMPDIDANGSRRTSLPFGWTLGASLDNGLALNNGAGSTGSLISGVYSGVSALVRAAPLGGWLEFGMGFTGLRAHDLQYAISPRLVPALDIRSFGFAMDFAGRFRVFRSSRVDVGIDVAHVRAWYRSLVTGTDVDSDTQELVRFQQHDRRNWFVRAGLDVRIRLGGSSFWKIGVALDHPVRFSGQASTLVFSMGVLTSRFRQSRESQ